MRRREGTPPGRPSVSRLSLGKIKGKQGAPGSIAIRFNAASMEDDDDYDDLSIGGSSTTKPRSDSVKFEIRKGDDAQVYSQSAPTSEVNTPVSAGSSVVKPAAVNSPLANDISSGSSAVKDEITPTTAEKSLLSGLKERIHDKLPEPINAFIGKIEVLKDASPEDIRKKFQKSESQESEGSIKIPQSESVDKISVRKSESTESTKSIASPSAFSKGSTSDLANRSRSRHCSTESEVSEAGNSIQNDTALKTDACFEVIEDYYNDDTFEEPTIISKHSTSPGIEPPHTKQRTSSFRKLIRQKDRSSSPAGGITTAMTLSGLLSSKSDDSIHSHTRSPDRDSPKDKEIEEFYDIDNQDSIAEETTNRKSQSSNNEAKTIPSITSSEDSATGISAHKLIAIGVCMVAYLIIPLPSFISGLVFGAALMYCTISAYNWLYVPPKQKEPFTLPDLKTLPSLVVPEMKESRNTDGKFQAWMNELQNYNPEDYHINLTASVYVTLEGTALRLQRPKLNVQKRAMWDEPAHNPTFIHQRHFDLEGSRVFLEPAGLVRKRLWSKKYPICIALANGSSQSAFEVKTHTSDANGKGQSQEDGSSVDKEKKLISQSSFDEEKIKNREKREKKLMLQMSLDEGRLKQMSSEGFELKMDDEKDGKVDAVEANPKDNDTDEGFDFVSKEECDTKILYLFGRTGREKEEWYRRLVAASMGQPWPTRMSDLRKKLKATEPMVSPTRSTSPGPDSNSGGQLRKRHSSSSLETITPTKQHQRQGSADSATFSPTEASPVTDIASSPKPTANPSVHPNSNTNCYEKVLVEYMRYMSVVLPANQKSKPGSRATSPMGSSSNKRELKESSKDAASERCDQHCVWVNTFISRCFWDFLREDYWAEYMKQKIQRKLSKIHVPFFIDDLTVTDIMLGCEMPVIRRMSRPYLDDRGLWIDMDVAYNGGFQMSLETKVNLMKLKKEKLHSRPGSHRQTSRRAAVHNEDEEDSAESSTDEEAEVTTYVNANDAEATGGSTGKKFLRLVDKLTQNKYFQQATENKFVKRAMEGVSNTPLMLNVELRSLIGTLAVNIPPPPTDRIWYGFRTNPRLWLSAKPKVGERAVTVTHVTEWIEKKLSVEFQRVFVMPNMDDLPIPLMCDHLPDNQPTFESAL